MYVSTWPALTPLHFIGRPSSGRLPFPFYARRKKYGYLARGLIYHLIKALELKGVGTVLVPDYHHGNEVAAIRAAGAKVASYRINADLSPDLEDLERQMTPEVRVLLVIHYLGWPQPIDVIAAIAKRHDVTLIEDCALSMFTEYRGQPVGTIGDFAIFCLYKMLPVPHGGLLVTNGAPIAKLEELSLRQASALSVAGRTLELLLEATRTRFDTVGKHLMDTKRLIGGVLSSAGVARAPVGDVGFDLARAGLGASPLVHHLLERVDLEAIPEARRARFAQLASRLLGRASFLALEPGPGTCPLFFPLLVEDKRAAVELLVRRGIGAVQFWASGDPELVGERTSGAERLRRHLIELPIHQDVTPEDVDRMADVVIQSKLGLLDSGSGRTADPWPGLALAG